MRELFTSIPIEIWALSLTVLLSLLTLLLTRNRTYALLTFSFMFGTLAVIWCILLLESYLVNHVIATQSENGISDQVSRSGWPLLIDAWPIWLIPAAFASAITALLCLWFIPHGNGSYLEAIQQAGQSMLDERTPTPTVTSSHLVLKEFELNELKRKLAISEEKFRQVKGEGNYKSVRVDKYTTEINELRQKLPEMQAQIAKLKEEKVQLRRDLEAAHKLLDDLMSRGDSQY